MGTFILTGASSGIGKAIAEKLLENNHTVYGIGRDFKDFEHPNLIKITADLTKTTAIAQIKKQITKEIDGLINAAGVAYYGTHESLTQEQIAEMVDVNIKAPMLLTNAFLPQIRKTEGIIINISSITGKRQNNTHGVAYGATKAALTSFGASLFEEIRKQNVRVTTIHPDLTATNLYRNADFTPGSGEGEALAAEDIGLAVMQVINAPKGMNIEDITIRPQKFKIEKKAYKC